MKRNRVTTPWQVEIEAMPIDINAIGHYVMEVKVDAVSQHSAIARARTRIMRKHDLDGSKFRTRTISCNELQK